MSPEQVRGQAADHRTDIFAFGAILYEMLTGRRAFTGESDADVLTAILKDDPPLSTGTGRLTDASARVIRRCLEKDPERRFQHARDLEFALEALSAPPREAEETGAGRKRSIAVLPFKNLAGPSAESQLGVGLADSAITELALVQSLLVRPTAAILKYRDRPADPQEAGRELGVDAVLDGSFQSAGSRLRVTVQLVDTASGRPLWGTKIDASLEDVFAMQDEVSRRIAEALQVRLTPSDERRLAGAARPVAAPAHELYLKGRFLLFSETRLPAVTSAIECFEKALELDPDSALAMIGLADAWSRMAFSFDPDGGWYEKAEALTDRVLAVSPGLPEGHYLRGRLLWTPRRDFDHAGAMREFFAAIAASPSLGEAHHFLALLLLHVGLLEESLRAGRQALAIYPDDLATQHIGLVRLLQGHYNEGREISEDALARASSAWTYYQLAQCQIRMDRSAEAALTTERAAREYPDHVLVLSLRGLLAAVAGEAERARDVCGRGRTPQEVVRPLSPRGVRPGVHPRSARRAPAGGRDAARERPQRLPLPAVFRDRPVPRAGAEDRGLHAADVGAIEGSRGLSPPVRLASNPGARLSSRLESHVHLTFGSGRRDSVRAILRPEGAVMSKHLKSAREASVRVLSLVVLLYAIPVLAQRNPVVVTVDECLPPLSEALATATGPRPDGACSYFWTLSGGVITGGQNSATLQFHSGPPGTPITISAEAVGPGGCFGIGNATSRTGPVASASGNATICRGYSTPLVGSGGPSCLWTPADGLSDPQSCTPMASPTRSTRYFLQVADEIGCPSTNFPFVDITLPFDPPDGVSVDPSLPPDTSGLTASVWRPSDFCDFFWHIEGGTITSIAPRGRSVTFTSGPPGTRVVLRAETDDHNPRCFLQQRYGRAQVDFADVPPEDLFHEDVAKIGRRGITAGCGAGRFCPDAPVRRDQTAALLMKAAHGAACTPPVCEGLFSDVPCSSPFASWVEMLKADGITAGCGSDLFCPERHVTRAQMAVFLLKSLHGVDYVPTPCTRVFADVDCPAPFADWIEAAYLEGIVGACQADPLLFCPDLPVTRGWMAAFLARVVALN